MAIRSNQFAVRPKQLSIARREHIRWGGSRPECIAKAIDISTLEIDTAKERRANQLPAIPQKAPSLFRTLDIPAEENYSGGLQPFQQGSNPRIHLRAVEADNEKLPEPVRQKISSNSLMHQLLNFFLQLS
jgi:hypothetical protein